MTIRSQIAAGVVIGLTLIAIGAIAIRSVTSFIRALPDGSERPPFKIVSSSPRQTHTITVERKQVEHTEKTPWDWKIHLSHTLQGRLILNEVEVDIGEWSSSPYWNKSPQLNWIHENTFRLDDTAPLPESKSDVLFVRNDSASAISYLYIRGEANERFFILNLEPKASLKLHARPLWKRGDLAAVAASGQFSNGGKIGAAMSFILPPSGKGPGCYCLTAKEEGITIVSRDLEGWNQVEFTSEEKRQMEEYYKKHKAGQRTEADEKAFNDIFSNRVVIITPKAPDCGPR
jgi:hypothetical protein